MTPLENILEFKEEFETVKPQIKEICSALASIIPEMRDATRPVADAITEVFLESCIEAMEDERVPKALAANHLAYIEAMGEQLEEMGYSRQERLRLIVAGLSRR